MQFYQGLDSVGKSAYDEQALHLGSIAYSGPADEGRCQATVLDPVLSRTLRPSSVLQSFDRANQAGNCCANRRPRKEPIDFQIFTTAYVISGVDAATGGPGQSMLFYVLYLYSRAFGRVGPAGFQMGYASALAWILFLIILAVTLIQLALANRWVYYESEG